jgi:replication-associated recombination protein RarA
MPIRKGPPRSGAVSGKKAPRSTVTGDRWTTVRTRHGLVADEVISALQKEIRRGNTENAALLAYEMIGTSARLEAKMWQRLLTISVEDVGLGNGEAPILAYTLFRMHELFERGEGERRLFAIHTVRLLCRAAKDRSSDEMSAWIKAEVESGRRLPSIPDYALDMHTAAGRSMGRDARHFYEEASRVSPELAGRDTTYRQRLLSLLSAE